MRKPLLALTLLGLLGNAFAAADTTSVAVNEFEQKRIQEFKDLPSPMMMPMARPMPMTVVRALEPVDVTTLSIESVAVLPKHSKDFAADHDAATLKVVHQLNAIATKIAADYGGKAHVVSIKTDTENHQVYGRANIAVFTPKAPVMPPMHMQMMMHHHMLAAPKLKEAPKEPAPSKAEQAAPEEATN